MGRPKGETPAKTNAERARKHRDKQTAEGKTEIAVFLGPKAYARLIWLQEQHTAKAGRPISQSEVIAGALQFTFDRASEVVSEKPDDL